MHSYRKICTITCKIHLKMTTKSPWGRLYFIIQKTYHMIYTRFKVRFIACTHVRKRLTGCWNCGVSKPRDRFLELSHRFEILQAPRHPCCDTPVKFLNDRTTPDTKFLPSMPCKILQQDIYWIHKISQHACEIYTKTQWWQMGDNGHGMVINKQLAWLDPSNPFY